jgi:hypothetical protein
MDGFDLFLNKEKDRYINNEIAERVAMGVFKYFQSVK